MKKLFIFFLMIFCAVQLSAQDNITGIVSTYCDADIAFQVKAKVSPSGSVVTFEKVGGATVTLTPDANDTITVDFESGPTGANLYVGDIYILTVGTFFQTVTVAHSPGDLQIQPNPVCNNYVGTTYTYGLNDTRAIITLEPDAIGSLTESYIGAGIEFDGTFHYFNPNVAGVGNHEILYSGTNAVTGCVYMDTIYAYVLDNPTITFSEIPSTFCVGASAMDGSFTLDQSGLALADDAINAVLRIHDNANGTSSDVALSGNSFTIPASAFAVAGDYTLRLSYSYGTDMACEAMQQDIPFSVSTSAATISGLNSSYPDGTSPSFTVEPSGGIFTVSTGGNVTENAGVYTFTHSGVGTYTVDYSVMSNGCLFTASTTVEITENTCTVPTPTATVYTDSVVISWATMSGAQSYQVRIRPMGSTTWNFYNVTSAQKVFTTLTPNQIYEYRVRAKCNNNTVTQFSTTQTFSTSLSCTAPTITNIYTWGSSMSIEWSNVGAVSYDVVVYYPDGSTGQIIEGSTSTWLYFDGLDVGTYTIGITANCLDATSTETVGTFEITPMVCNSVANAGVSVLEDDATIYWDWSADAYAYYVELSGVGYYVNDNYAMFTDLAAGSYTASIQAYCNNGLMSEAVTVSFTVEEMLECLTPSINNISISCSTATVRWNSVANASSYIMEFYPILNPENVTVATVAQTSGTVSQQIIGLEPNVKYSVHVKAICGVNNESAYSTTRNFRTLAGCREGEVTYEPITAISVYPNPSNGISNIQFVSDVEGMAKISVMDMMGRVVKTQNATTIIGENEVELNLSNVAKGLYMVSLQAEGTNQTFRLTIE